VTLIEFAVDGFSGTTACDSLPYGVELPLTLTR
jgi:hypothetical protein